MASQETSISADIKVRRELEEIARELTRRVARITVQNGGPLSFRVADEVISTLMAGLREGLDTARAAGYFGVASEDGIVVIDLKSALEEGLLARP